MLFSLTFVPFDIIFFEWQCKKFKHQRLLDIEIVALSSELAASILSECLEFNETFSIAQSVRYKEQYGMERLSRLL